MLQAPWLAVFPGLAISLAVFGFNMLGDATPCGIFLTRNSPEEEGERPEGTGLVDNLRPHCYHNSISVITGGFMVRTQIQLTEEQARAVKRMASAEGVSAAEIIRRAIGKIIRADKALDEGERHKRALAIVGKFRSGKRDISGKHDEYLGEAYRRGEYSSTPPRFMPFLTGMTKTTPAPGMPGKRPSIPKPI